MTIINMTGSGSMSEVQLPYAADEGYYAFSKSTPSLNTAYDSWVLSGDARVRLCETTTEHVYRYQIIIESGELTGIFKTPSAMHSTLLGGYFDAETMKLFVVGSTDAIENYACSVDLTATGTITATPLEGDALYAAGFFDAGTYLTTRNKKVTLVTPEGTSDLLSFSSYETCRVYRTNDKAVYLKRYNKYYIISRTGNVVTLPDYSTNIGFLSNGDLVMVNSGNVYRNDELWFSIPNNTYLRGVIAPFDFPAIWGNGVIRIFETTGLFKDFSIYSPGFSDSVFQIAPYVPVEGSIFAYMGTRYYDVSANTANIGYYNNGEGFYLSQNN